MLGLLKFTTLLSLAVLVSCAKESDKNKNSDGPGREPRDRDTETKVCLDGVVKELLGDGRTALVRSNEFGGKTYLWDYISDTARNDIVSIFNLDVLNDSGSLLLRTFDNVRFHIQETKNTNGGFRDLRLFARGSNPLVKFSDSGDHLVSTRRRGSSVRNQIDVFDIFKKDIIWNASFNRIISAALKNQSRGALVTYNMGSFQLNIFNPSLRRIERGIKLEGRGFGELRLSDSAVLVKMREYLYSFDGDTGALNSRIRLNQLVDVDKFSDYALISTEPFEYWVVNLITGELETRVDISETDRLSSCQLNYSEGVVACIDPSKVSSVNLYFLGNQTSKSTCLSNSP